jgi:ribulose bisphosphate carboxylase small subunit
MKLRRGPFLEEYFEIEENTAIEIERECQDSFVWAAFFAEFYREEGRVDELRKVLINRTEKYIRDLEIRATGMTIEDVKKVLSLLSLVTPVKWKEDKKYFEEIFEESLPEYEYEHLKRIISLAGETNILLVSDGEYAIKPDPVADFIRTDFIRDKRFNRLLNSLLPYMPFRISYNIGVIPRFKAEIEEVFTVLGNIWVKLNSIKGQTPEYFSALVLFTGYFTHVPFFDINEANMSLWIESYKDIRRTHPEKEVREELVKCLFNATSDYGRADKFEKMEESLEELRKLHDAHPEKEVRETLAKGLVNATNHYGRADKFEKMEESLEELRKLHDAHPEKEVREELAKGLVNATNHYGRANKFEKMEESLEELRKLHDAHPEEKEVRETLASGLVNAASHYGRADKFEKMEESLEELRKLHDAHPEKEVREELVKCLFNATRDYGRADKFEKMEESLEELRKLHDAHPEKEVRETLAKGLFNATHYLGDRDGGYENLFLLFVLRFDLPDDSNRERFIKIIEDLLIKETIKIVEDKYKEGEEHLAEFIDWMKAEIENQTEVVLLMDKLSEKLDVKVQKKLWALLT